MNRSAIVFVAVFLSSLLIFSIVIRIDAVDRNIIVPFTALIARAGSVTLNLFGMDTEVIGTVIMGERGFAVDILNGCNGIYVVCIVVSAVLAFPSTKREKLVGLLLGITGVQIVNLVRIISLYYIGLTNPALFERFHHYVWQTGVIVISMAIWIYWAEVLVAAPTRQRT